MSKDHFNAFKRTVARLKAQGVKQQHVAQAKQHVHTQQVQKFDSTVITATTAKLSDEQYKASIIAKAIAHIKKRIM